MSSGWQHKLFHVATISCAAFILLSAAAMIAYPGGTIHHVEAHYLFFKNPFSDLGRTRMFDGRSNTASMTLFITAMIAGAIGLAGFFVGFAGTLRKTSVSRIGSIGGAGLGILAAICFIGVACTPWDLYMGLHIQFVLCAFRSLLLATVLDLIAVLAEGRARYRLIGPFAAFIALLFFYIILLTAGMSPGPAANAILQATGQKIIVYSAILMVLVQSRQMRRRSSNDHGPKSQSNPNSQDPMTRPV